MACFTEDKGIILPGTSNSTCILESTQSHEKAIGNGLSELSFDMNMMTSETAQYLYSTTDC